MTTERKHVLQKASTFKAAPETDRTAFKKLYTAIRETGEFIDLLFDADTDNYDDAEKAYQRGMKLIAEYEDEDKRNGAFEINFYEIVNEDRETIVAI